MTATATPTKLRNGDWGARVTGAVSSGDTVTITTKAGKSWTATVDRVVWTNGDVTIVSTRKSAHRTSNRTEDPMYDYTDYQADELDGVETLEVVGSLVYRQVAREAELADELGQFDF